MTNKWIWGRSTTFLHAVTNSFTLWIAEVKKNLTLVTFLDHTLLYGCRLELICRKTITVIPNGRVFRSVLSSFLELRTIGCHSERGVKTGSESIQCEWRNYWVVALQGVREFPPSYSLDTAISQIRIQNPWILSTRNLRLSFLRVTLQYLAPKRSLFVSILPS